MKNILKSWKTSLLGGGALTAGIVSLVQDPTNWKQGVSLLVVGIVGLLAKDAGATHSTPK